MSEDERHAPPTPYALLWKPKEVLLGVPGWEDYVRGVYTIDRGGYPFLSYLGINFTPAGIKNYKLYFSFFKRLSPGELDLVLPVKDRGHFDALYAQWQPTKEYRMIHRGTTFALKIEPGRPLTYYYHLRIPGLPFGLPERLTLTAQDRDQNFHGACEEFTGEKIHLKRYFYAHDRATVAQSLKEAGLPDRTDSVECIEYIESDGRDKVAWISDDEVLIGALVSQQGPPRLAAGLSLLCRNSGFRLFGPGSSRGNSDHSIYFTEATGPRGDYGYFFDGARTFIERTLKLPALPGVR